MRTEICMKLQCKDCKNYKHCFKEEKNVEAEDRWYILKNMQKNFINPSNGKNAEKHI